MHTSASRWLECHLSSPDLKGNSVPYKYRGYFYSENLQFVAVSTAKHLSVLFVVLVGMCVGKSPRQLPGNWLQWSDHYPIRNSVLVLGNVLMNLRREEREVHWHSGKKSASASQEICHWHLLPPIVGVLLNGRRLIHEYIHPHSSERAVLPEAQVEVIFILFYRLSFWHIIDKDALRVILTWFPPSFYMIAFRGHKSGEPRKAFRLRICFQDL